MFVIKKDGLRHYVRNDGFFYIIVIARNACFEAIHTYGCPEFLPLQE